MIFHVSRRSFSAGWANGKIIVIELQVTWTRAALMACVDVFKSVHCQQRAPQLAPNHRTTTATTAAESKL